MSGWFGRSWGAPCCALDDQVMTPIGMKCLICLIAIREGDQGITMPLLRLDGPATTCAYHLDCYLKTILPHTADCVRCRGRERDEHETWCQYRMLGGECSCHPTRHPVIPPG